MSPPTTFQASAAGEDHIWRGDPWTRVRYRYGMLLGAEDFSMEQAANVLALRIHQAVLHGSGAVRGLAVSRKETDVTGTFDQLEVAPGLAVTPLGASVWVDVRQCLDVSALNTQPEWGDLEEVELEGVGGTLRCAYVVLRHQACLERPVPAISSPCDPCGEPSEGVAYGLIRDRFRIDLVSERPPSPQELQREWLNLAEVTNGRDPPDPPESYRTTLRDRLLSWELLPADKLPEIWRRAGDAPVLLAKVLLREVSNAVDVVRVDNSVRPILPPVQLLAEELFGYALGEADDARAFRVRDIEITADSVAGDMKVEVAFTQKIKRETVTLGGSVLLLVLGGSGSPPTFGWTSLDDPARIQLEVDPGDASRLSIVDRGGVWATGTVYQVLLRGEGPTPLLDHKLRRLWGYLDPGPELGRNGRDVSLIDEWKGAP